MVTLPESTRWVIVGSGFAGAATAWALGRAGLGPGVVLEHEAGYGSYASGRNAAMLRLAEGDRVIRLLTQRSLAAINRLDEDSAGHLIERSGGLTLAASREVHLLEGLHRALAGDGAASALLPAGDARARFPLLDLVQFDTALWCPSEGVVDIHALLTLYLQLARDAGFPLITRCGAEALIVEGGCVKGVRTRRGDVRAEVVVDASGAWAGRLGRADEPLPIRPMKRHLFVFGPPAGGHRSGPFTWMEEPTFYFRPEGDGLLFSPCDETLVPPPEPPSDPPPDPRAAELLAGKLKVCAAPFLSLPLRRWWACLRTFAPDRRPYVGADADLPGLFHVSALGGFGVGASAAIGELAGDLLVGRAPDWIDPAAVSPARVLAR